MSRPFGVIRRNDMTLADDADYELPDTSGLFATGVNLMPMPSTVQSPRLLYGNKFFEQALPLVNREAPLVRNLNNQTGRSWDHTMGKHLGAVRAEDDEDGATVRKVTDDMIELALPDGTIRQKELYNLFPGNRFTLTHNTPKVAKGDVVKAGQTLAPSNFTDDEGRMALGLNARIAVVPYKGLSMDDAIVISQSMADRLVSDHAETVDIEKDEDLKTGKQHFISLFPKKYKQEQLEKLDDSGLPLPGQVFHQGDPVMLATRPRSFNSNKQVSRLSRAQRFVRRDSSLVWEGDDDATVLGVSKTRDGGHRILLRYQATVKPADKIVLRPGQKSTVSKILPDDKMPRTESGEPIEILFNSLGLPSRVNAETFYELMLGKIAEKTGKPYVLPQFLPNGQSWYDFVKNELEKHGISDAERIYDPEEDRFLDNPVSVGKGFVMKLHHRAGKKLSYRGQKGYSADFQPLKGKGQGAQRLSGLEMTVLHSSGGRGVQKESVLLRGEMRDDFWRALRSNRRPGNLGKPFVWSKFLGLLQGAGIDPEDKGKGVLRLTPMTRSKLDSLQPVEIKNDGIVDLRTLEPKVGGLFDPALVREGRWGYVQLKEPVVNPAYESVVRTLLGLTKEEFEALLDEVKKPDEKVESD